MKTMKIILAILVMTSVAGAQLPVSNVNGIDFSANNTQAVSVANHGRIRYNSATGILEQSVNGAAYAAFGVPASRRVNAGTGLSGGGPLSADVTLNIANTAVTPGTYGDATHTPVVTVNAQGQFTAASTSANAVVPTSRQVNAGTGLSGGGPLSADVTLNIANTAVASGTYGDAIHTPVVTVNAQGQLTAASTSANAVVPTSRTISTSSPLAGGGSLAGNLTLACSTCLNGSPSAVGDLMYSTAGGPVMTRLADVALGQVLHSGGIGAAPAYSAIVNSDLPTSGVTAGSCTSCNLTVNAQGIVTAQSNGSGGATNHLQTGGSAPTCAATSHGGTVSSCVCTGTDSAGQCIFVVVSGGVGPDLIKFSFSTPFNFVPRGIAVSAGATDNASLLYFSLKPYWTSTINDWTFNLATPASELNGTYTFNYIIVGSPN